MLLSKHSGGIFCYFVGVFLWIGLGFFGSFCLFAGFGCLFFWLFLQTTKCSWEIMRRQRKITNETQYLGTDLQIYN